MIQHRFRAGQSLKLFVAGIVLATMLVLPGHTQTITYFDIGEEFCGPFPSWKNVKTDYGAKGDGTTDDAAAINSGLSTAGLKGGSSVANGHNVLYFPAGTYRITQPIKNTGRGGSNDVYNGMTIIGEDPATTVIKWDGATYTEPWTNTNSAFATGPMAVFDGWNVKFSRLTFDGSNKARIGILRDGGFGTYCEFSDIYVKNVRIGFHLGGNSGEGQAEDAILRCRFTNCVDCGVWGPNMNTMDEYVWYSLFEDCGTNISIGGYHAIGCVFLRTKHRDLGYTWAPPCIINNIAIGGNQFASIGNTQSAFMMGNQVFDYDSATYFGSNLPYFVMLDNKFNVTPTLRCSGDRLLSVGNTFSRQTNPLTLEQTGRLISFVNIDQKIVSAASLPAPTTISLPGAPKKLNRQIFEVTKGTASDANEIQAKIVAAYSATPCGIVHIPSGLYNLNKTILVPANKDVQIVGDAAAEYGTRISWNGTGSGPGFRLMGPSRVTMRDIMLDFRSGSADIMRVENCDQIGGRIWCEQVLAGGVGTANADKAFLIDTVENSDIYMLDGCANTTANGGVVVRGGNIRSGRAAGTASGQVLFMFGGMGNSFNLFNVLDGGELIALGARDECPVAGSLVNLTSSSSGKLTIGGMSWAVMGSNSVPTVSVNGFNGSLTFAGNSVGPGYSGAQARYFGISGDGSKANVLNVASAISDWRDNSSPAASAQMVPCGIGNVGALQNTINKAATSTVDTQFIRNSLGQLRSMRIEPPIKKPEGVTDLQLLRVRTFAATNKVGFIFQGSPGKINPGVLDRQQAMQSAHLGSMVKLAVGGRAFSMPLSAKSVMVYNALGRMILNKNIADKSDAAYAERSIQSIRRNNIVFVRIME